jgi:molecular chaperone HscB
MMPRGPDVAATQRDLAWPPSAVGTAGSRNKTDRRIPMTSVDHFARFGLPRAIAVDRKALDRAYERQSFRLHPDLLAAAPESEQQQAQQAAADLNEAYRTLASDPERAAYLLGLLIADARASGRLAAGAKLNTEALPDGFLQEMFLLQEEVDDVGARGDPAALSHLRSQVESRQAATLRERTQLFDAGAVDLQAIQSNLNQERYLVRLLERLANPAPDGL